MQLLILTTILSHVFCEQATLRTKNGPMQFTGFDKCVEISGTALSVETDHGVEVQIFKGKECGRGPYAWGTGRWEFKPPYSFQAVRLVHYKSYKTVESDESQVSHNENQGGEEQASPSSDETSKYYSPKLDAD